MKNSSFRNYKEKILEGQSESDLKEWEEPEPEPEMGYYEEEDTLDEFVKEFDVQKLISSAFDNENSEGSESFECLNRYHVTDEDEDEILEIS